MRKLLSPHMLSYFDCPITASMKFTEMVLPKAAFRHKLLL